MQEIVDSAAAGFRVRHGHWLMILPPFAILTVAVLLFDNSSTMSMDAFAQLTRDLTRATAPPDLPQTLAELRGRYIWLTSVVLNTVVPIGSAILCGLIVHRSHDRSGRRVALGLGLLLCAAGAATLFGTIATKGVLYRAVFAFTYLTLENSQRFTPEFLGYTHMLVSLINGLAVVVPVVAVLAASSTIRHAGNGGNGEIGQLAAQMRDLKEVLYTGSAILVVGILHMGSWLRWPSTLVADPGLHQAVLGVALSVTLFWGATFSLVLIASYAPAAGILARRARALWESDPGIQHADHPNAWLKERGFFVGISEELPQIAVIFAPLLAGPLGALVAASIEASR